MLRSSGSKGTSKYPPLEVKSIIFSILLTCLLTLTALGQQTTGALTGTVGDASGAIVPGATVILKNSETGTLRQAVTDDQGAFGFQSLEPGQYSITVEKTGFKKAQASKITVEV